MPAPRVNPPSGSVHLASLVTLPSSCPRPQAASPTPHTAPDLRKSPIRPENLPKTVSHQPVPLRGRAGERQFPLSSPRMDHALDSENEPAAHRR